MAILANLSQAVAAYRNGSLQFDDFEDRFRFLSRHMFADGDDALKVCLAIEAALSRFRFENVGDDALKDELGDIEIPFAPSKVLVVAPWSSANNSANFLDHVWGLNAVEGSNSNFFSHAT